MKTLKLLSVVISICILLLSFPAHSNALSLDICRESPKIAGKSSNLIYIEMGKGRTGEITIGTGKFYTVDTAQNHISRKNAENGKTVAAAVNGGYFDAYSNGFTTYAAIVQNGILVNGGSYSNKPVLGFTPAGEALIDRVGIHSEVVIRSSAIAKPWAMNIWYNDPTAVMLFNSSLGKVLDIPDTCTLVYIQNNIVSRIITGTKTSLGPIPEGTVVLAYNQASYRHARENGLEPQAGNSAVLKTVMEPSIAENRSKWNSVVTAVSAGPMILLGGKDVSDQNSDFTEAKQSPTYVALRAFAAKMKDGRLLLGTATASVKQLAVYLLSIGAMDAMSLDGGASTMLYEKDSGYLVSAGRKLSNVLSIVDYSSGMLPSINPATDQEKASPWAQADIDKARVLGLITENADGAYQTNITRQEFCNLAMKLLLTVMGEDALNKTIWATGMSYDDAMAAFTDTYHQDVINCYRLNIVNGKSKGIFDPNASLSREEAAKMLSKVCEYLKIEASGQEPVFQDTGEISTWAGDFVSFICKTGIMNGKASALITVFDPHGYYSRQEAVITMLRMYNKSRIQ